MLLARTLSLLSLAASLVLFTGLFLFFAWGSSVETYAAQLAADHLKCFQFPPSEGAAQGRRAAGAFPA